MRMIADVPNRNNPKSAYFWWHIPIFWIHSSLLVVVRWGCMCCSWQLDRRQLSILIQLTYNFLFHSYRQVNAWGRKNFIPHFWFLSSFTIGKTFFDISLVNVLKSLSWVSMNSTLQNLIRLCRFSTKCEISALEAKNFECLRFTTYYANSKFSHFVVRIHFTYSESY